MKNLTLCLATSTWMFLAAFLPESQMLAQTRFIGAAMLDQNPAELVYRVQYGAYSTAVRDVETPYPLDDKESLSGPDGLTIHVGPKHSHIEDARAELSRALNNQCEDAFLTAYLNGAKVSMDDLSQKKSPLCHPSTPSIKSMSHPMKSLCSIKSKSADTPWIFLWRY